jgi:hypothetical protein
VPREQSPAPSDIAVCNRVRHIVNLNRQKRAEFAQIVQRRSGRRRTVGGVASVQVSAGIAKYFHKWAAGMKRGHVQWSCPCLVASIDEARIGREHRFYARHIAGFDQREELRLTDHPAMLSCFRLLVPNFRENHPKLAIVARD